MIHSIRAVLLLTLLCVQVQKASADGVEICTDTSSLKAMETLRARIKSSGIYATRIKDGCFSYGSESCDPDTLVVAIREIHSEKCGGDVEVAPVIDRFRVLKRSGKIERYDSLDDDYGEFPTDK